MIGPDGYGDAEIRKRDDGTLEVVSADDVIGISVELLREALGFGLWVGGDGLIWLAGDPDYRYRPVRFVANVSGLSQDQAVEGCRMLVCERVRENVLSRGGVVGSVKIPANDGCIVPRMSAGVRPERVEIRSDGAIADAVLTTIREAIKRRGGGYAA